MELSESSVLSQQQTARFIEAGCLLLNEIRTRNYPCESASAPPTISRISLVMAAWRERLYSKRRSIALTPQELKVLYYAIQRRINADIATALEVSIATIKTHKNNLISKLGVAGKGAFQKFLLEMAHYRL